VYVGQSHCISGRIHFHFFEGVKHFDAFDFCLLLEATKQELDAAEAAEIFRLKPPLNKTLPRTGRYKRLTQIAHEMGTRTRKLQTLVDERGIQSFLGQFDKEEFVGVAM
jgi:hypothetical protein